MFSRQASCKDEVVIQQTEMLHLATARTARGATPMKVASLDKVAQEFEDYPLYGAFICE
jgi:hypothetical protein